MSRLIKKPLEIPQGVEVRSDGQTIHAKGSQGENSLQVNEQVQFKLRGDSIEFSMRDAAAKAMAGTMYALARNLIQGVHAGFERKLELVGVGYRAQARGQNLNLQLGFSHTIDYPIKAGVTIETPSQTEIVIKGVDKQKVGQVATEIRALRPPEPYKGKGVRYSDEQIIKKEAKKK